MNDDGASCGTTLVVELTPVGRAAVAVVLVVGPNASSVVGKLFAPARGGTLEEIPLGRIVLGCWNSPNGEELVVCRRSNERVEIHCHGGVAAVGAVIDSLVSEACQHVTWQEWLSRESDVRIRAAAQIALSEAPTARTAAILLDQYCGALSAAVHQAVTAARTTNWPLATEILDRVLRFRDIGQHLTRPWRVVLTGRTNVGKSSLINALAGFERAIVSHQPGTTRDVVTTTTAIDGWPVQLADTAGLRTTHDELEAAGVQLAVKTLQSADLVVVVEDATLTGNAPREEHANFSQVFAQSSATRPPIRVLNKIDLISPNKRAEMTVGAGGTISEREPRNEAQSPLLFTSAATGEGIAELVAAIGTALVPVAPPAGSAVPFTREQILVLDAANNACARRDASALETALQPLLAPQKENRSIIS
jgi:tRNA modification GTPase